MIQTKYSATTRCVQKHIYNNIYGLINETGLYNRNKILSFVGYKSQNLGLYFYILALFAIIFFLFLSQGCLGFLGVPISCFMLYFSTVCHHLLPLPVLCDVWGCWTWFHHVPVWSVDGGERESTSS